MKLYFKYLSTQLKTSFIYRGSSIMAILGQTLNTVAAFFSVYLLFLRFPSIAGYTFSEVMITFSVVTFSFYFSEMMFRGFDEFDSLVKTGALDTLLLRPRNVVLQLCGHKIEILKLGRVFFGLCLLIISCFVAPVQWTFIKVIVLIEMVVAGIVVFFGVYMFSCAITIFTIKTPEFINVLTYGARELCYYPIDVFKKFISKFFTFILPYATFNYIPLKYLLYGQSVGIWPIIYPWFSLVFTAIMYFVFNYSLKFYKSAG